MQFLSFSFLHLQYPLGLSILTFLQICLAYLIMLKSSSATGMFICLLNSFVSCLFIILEVISFFINHKQIKIDQNEVRYMASKPLTYYQVKMPFNYKILLFFFLLAIVSIIPNISLFFYIFQHLTFFSSIQAFAGIVFTWLFSFIFFRRKLLRHQMLGLGLIAIIIIAYFAVLYREALEMIEVFYSNTGIFIGFIIAYVASESSREVIEKYLMQIHYISHFVLLFTEGIFSLIILLIISLSLKSSCHKLSDCLILFNICEGSQWAVLVDEINNYFTQGPIHILLFVAYLLTYIFGSLMRILTNKKLSPSHRYISEISFSFYYIVLVRLCRIFGSEFEFVYRLQTKNWITEIGQFVFIIIACSIYNEYIIFHCCKLDTETAQEITVRGQNETDQLENLIKEGSSMDLDTSFE